MLTEAEKQAIMDEIVESVSDEFAPEMVKAAEENYEKLEKGELDIDEEDADE